MKQVRLAIMLLMGVALLIAPGCVELTGQRISWFYDIAKDEIQILIHYDGIHGRKNSDSDKNSIELDDSHENIPDLEKFVHNGDVMIIDWPCHLDMNQLRGEIQNKNITPLQKEWIQLCFSIKIESLGHYREPDGRIGAAQLITIPNAKNFLHRLNTLINQSILELSKKNHPVSRRDDRILSAVKQDHKWLEFNGQSIQLALPVDPDELPIAKRELLNSLFGNQGEKEARVNLPEVTRGVLSTMPISYIDDVDRVRFIIGRSNSFNTLRLQIRDVYEPSLEQPVMNTVKSDIDIIRADYLLNKKELPIPAMSVLRWGPPEETVRSLLNIAKNGDDSHKELAFSRLQEWAKQWNHEHGMPKAPEERVDYKTDLEAWKQWYHRMKIFPLELQNEPVKK